MRGWALILLLSCACGGEDHVLYVEVRTDLDPGTDFEMVRVEVVEESTGGTRRPMTVLYTPETTTDFAGGARVADFDMGSPGAWFVSADLLDPLDTPVRSGTSRVMVRGATTVTIVLDAADARDAGMDAGTVDPRSDAGPLDGGPADGGPADGGPADGGARDAGDVDSGSRDSGGDPSCPTCEEYCTTVMANCTGSQRVYSDEVECLTACMGFVCGRRGEVSGDTRACRLYHAGVAATDPLTHCPHAGPGSGGPCS